MYGSNASACGLNCAGRNLVVAEWQAGRRIDQRHARGGEIARPHFRGRNGRVLIEQVAADAAGVLHLECRAIGAVVDARGC